MGSRFVLASQLRLSKPGTYDDGRFLAGHIMCLSLTTYSTMRLTMAL